MSSFRIGQPDLLITCRIVRDDGRDVMTVYINGLGPVDFGVVSSLWSPKAGWISGIPQLRTNAMRDALTSQVRAIWTDTYPKFLAENEAA